MAEPLVMGLDILEKKFQAFIAEHPERIGTLHAIARDAASVQEGMRDLLDDITAELCPFCKASCCQCMPVEGWFTESDYFIYRMLHDPPFNLRVKHGLPRGCAFLGAHGCVLPRTIRPFPCVKVNCQSVTDALERKGRTGAFSDRYEALSALQERVWPLLADCLSTTVLQAQSL